MKRRLTTWIFITGTAIALTACGWTKQETAKQWLDSFPQDTQVDVGGKWADPGGGYDNNTGSPYGLSWMLLFQNGNKISGIFRGKEVMGVVSQENIYLTAIEAGVVCFTVHLTYDQKTKAMAGKICDYYCPQIKSDCQSIAFMQ